MTEDFSEGGNSIMMIRHKVVFVGDVSVGKTSVMNRFIENKFKDSYDPTIGVDFFSKTITVFKENTLKLQIWDSAGQERYKSLIPSYVRGASIIFIVYDISKKETFDNVPNWISFIKNVKVENALIVLCGNKLDLERHVPIADAEKLANKEGLLYYEVSAKTNQNIVPMFYTAIVELPFFEQFDISNKQKLIEQLINENQGETTDNNNSILEMTKNVKKSIDVQNQKPIDYSSNKSNCKC